MGHSLLSLSGLEVHSLGAHMMLLHVLLWLACVSVFSATELPLAEESDAPLFLTPSATSGGSLPLFAEVVAPLALVPSIGDSVSLDSRGASVGSLPSHASRNHRRALQANFVSEEALSVRTAQSVRDQAPSFPVPADRPSLSSVAFVDFVLGSSGSNCFPCKRLFDAAVSVSAGSLSGSTILVLPRVQSQFVDVVGGFGVSGTTLWDVQCSSATHFWATFSAVLRLRSCDVTADLVLGVPFGNVSCAGASSLASQVHAINSYLVSLRAQYFNGTDRWDSVSCPLVERRSAPSGAWLSARTTAHLAITGPFVIDASSSPHATLVQANNAGYVYGLLLADGGRIHLRPGAGGRPAISVSGFHSALVGGVVTALGSSAGVRIENASFSHVSAGFSGGAVFASQGAAVVISGGTVIRGGSSEAEAVAVSYHHLFLGYSSFPSGGAVAIERQGALLIEGETSISHCQAVNGGAIGCLNQTTCLVLQGSRIHHGTGTAGGAVMAYLKSFVLLQDNVTVSDSSASSGGCLWLLSQSVLRMRGLVRLDRCHSTHDGGSVFLQAQSVLTADSSTSFSHGSALGSGGCIFATDIAGVSFSGSMDHCSCFGGGGANHFERQSCASAPGCLNPWVSFSNTSDLSFCSSPAGCIMAVGLQSPQANGQPHFLDPQGASRLLVRIEGAVRDSSTTGVRLLGEHLSAVLTASSRIENCSHLTSAGGVRLSLGASVMLGGIIRQCSGLLGGGLFVDTSSVNRASSAILLNGASIVSCRALVGGGGANVGVSNPLDAPAFSFNDTSRARPRPRPLLVLDAGSLVSDCSVSSSSEQVAGGAIRVQFGRLVLRPNSTVQQSAIALSRSGMYAFGHCVALLDGSTAHIRGRLLDCGPRVWGAPVLSSSWIGFGGAVAVVRVGLTVPSFPNWLARSPYLRIARGTVVHRGASDYGGGVGVLDFTASVPSPPAVDIVALSANASLPAWIGVRDLSLADGGPVWLNMSEGERSRRRLFRDDVDVLAVQNGVCSLFPSLWVCSVLPVSPDLALESFESDPPSSGSFTASVGFPGHEQVSFPNSVMFLENRAVSFSGGGVCLFEQGQLRISASGLGATVLFEGNEAALDGGGVILQQSVSSHSHLVDSSSLFNRSYLLGSEQRPVVIWAADPRFDRNSEALLPSDTAWVEASVRPGRHGGVRPLAHWTLWPNCASASDCGISGPQDLALSPPRGRVVFERNTAASCGALCIHGLDPGVVVGIEVRRCVAQLVSPLRSEEVVRSLEHSQFFRAGAVAWFVAAPHFSPHSRVLWASVFSRSESHRGQVPHLVLSGLFSLNPPTFPPETPQVSHDLWSGCLFGSIVAHGFAPASVLNSARSLPGDQLYSVAIVSLSRVSVTGTTLVGGHPSVGISTTAALGVFYSDAKLEGVLMHHFGSFGFGGGVDSKQSSLAVVGLVASSIYSTLGGVLSANDRVAVDRACVFHNVRSRLKTGGIISADLLYDWTVRRSMATGEVSGAGDAAVYVGEGNLVNECSGDQSVILSVKVFFPSGVAAAHLALRGPNVFVNGNSTSAAAGISLLADSAAAGHRVTFQVLPPHSARVLSRLGSLWPPVPSSESVDASRCVWLYECLPESLVSSLVSDGLIPSADSIGKRWLSWKPHALPPPSNRIDTLMGQGYGYGAATVMAGGVVFAQVATWAATGLESAGWIRLRSSGSMLIAPNASLVLLQPETAPSVLSPAYFSGGSFPVQVLVEGHFAVAGLRGAVDSSCFRVSQVNFRVSASGIVRCLDATLRSGSAILLVSSTMLVQGTLEIVGSWPDASEGSSSSGGIVLSSSEWTVDPDGSMLVANSSANEAGRSAGVTLYASAQLSVNGRGLIANVTYGTVNGFRYGACVSLISTSQLSVQGVLRLSRCRSDTASAIAVYSRSSLHIGSALSTASAGGTFDTLVQDAAGSFGSSARGLDAAKIVADSAPSSYNSTQWVDSSLLIAEEWAESALRVLESRGEVVDSHWPLSAPSLPSTRDAFLLWSATVPSSPESPSWRVPNLVVDRCDAFEVSDSGDSTTLLKFRATPAILVFADVCLDNVQLHGVMCVGNRGGCAAIHCISASEGSVLRLSRIAAVGNENGLIYPLTGLATIGPSGAHGGGLGIGSWRTVLAAGIAAWGNCAAHFGGGIAVYSSSQVYISGVSLVGNRAGTGSDLAVDSSVRSLVNRLRRLLPRCSGFPLSSNRAVAVQGSKTALFSGHGGGASFSEGAHVALSRARVLGNSATGSGGGVFVGNSAYKLVLQNSTVQDNQALGIGGGGIAALPLFEPVINPTLILAGSGANVSGNYAASFGGGVLASSAHGLYVCPENVGAADLSLWALGLAVPTNATLRCRSDMVSNRASSGGSIASLGSHLVAHSLHLRGGSARRAGAIMVEAEAALVFLRLGQSSLLDHTASCRIGGLSCGTVASTSLVQASFFNVTELNNVAPVASGNRCGSWCSLDGCPLLDTTYDGTVFVGHNVAHSDCCGSPENPCLNVSVAMSRLSSDEYRGLSSQEVVLHHGVHESPSLEYSGLTPLTIRGATAAESALGPISAPSIADASQFSLCQKRALDRELSLGANVVARWRDTWSASVSCALPVLWKLGPGGLLSTSPGGVTLGRLVVHGGRNASTCLATRGEGAKLSLTEAVVTGCRDWSLSCESGSLLQVSDSAILGSGGLAGGVVARQGGWAVLHRSHVIEFERGSGLKVDWENCGSAVTSVGAKSVVEIVDSSLVGLGRSGFGGVLCAIDGGTAHVNSSFVQEGESRGGGGCVASIGSASTVSLLNASIDGCRSGVSLLSSGLLAEGGGVLVSGPGSDASIHSSHVSSCSALKGRGGGIAVQKGGNLFLVQANLTGCVSGRNGGCLSVSTSTMTADDTMFEHCQSGSSGGAVALTAAPVAEIRNSRMHWSTGSSGGCLDSVETDVQVRNVSFNGCTAQSGSGGAARLQGGEWVFSHVGVRNCSAAVDGGALSLQDSVLGLVEDLTVLDTAAGRHGGALEISNSVPAQLRMRSVSVVRTVAESGSGGAMYIVATLTLGGQNSMIQADKVTIRESRAPAGSGGALLVDGIGTMVSMSQLTVTGSTSRMAGCVLVSRRAQLEAAGSSLTGCGADWLGKAVLVHDAMLNLTGSRVASAPGPESGPLVAVLTSRGSEPGVKPWGLVDLSRGSFLPRNNDSVLSMFAPLYCEGKLRPECDFGVLTSDSRCPINLAPLRWHITCEGCLLSLPPSNVHVQLVGVPISEMAKNNWCGATTNSSMDDRLMLRTCLPPAFQVSSALPARPRLESSVRVVGEGIRGGIPLRPLAGLDGVDGPLQTVLVARTLFSQLRERLEVEVSLDPSSSDASIAASSRSAVLESNVVDLSGVGIDRGQAGEALTFVATFSHTKASGCVTRASIEARGTVVLPGCPGGEAVAAGVCTACPLGRYSLAGDRACHSCPIGSFGVTTGMSECVPCPWGSVSPQVGSFECVPCPRGTTAGTGRSQCVICQSLVFDCPGGPELPQLRPGFWSQRWADAVRRSFGRFLAASNVEQELEDLVSGAVKDWVACPVPELCPGLALNGSAAVDSGCRAGHDGPLCQSCQEGWARPTSGTCTPCAAVGGAQNADVATELGTLAAIGTIISLLVVYVAVFAAQSQQADTEGSPKRFTRRALLRLALNHVQLLMVLQALWEGSPLVVVTWLKALAPVGGDLATMPPLVCAIAKGDVVSMWQFQLALPFVLCAAVPVVQSIVAAIYAGCSRMTPGERLTNSETYSHKRVLFSASSSSATAPPGQVGVLTTRKRGRLPQSSPAKLVDVGKHAILEEESALGAVKDKLRRRVQVKSVREVWAGHQYLQAWLVLAVAFYSTQAQVSARVLQCTSERLVGDYRVSADTDLVCGEGPHRTAMILAICIGIVPCIVLPLALCCSGLRSASIKRGRWSFLAEGYRPQIEWFEALIFLRKLALVVTSVVSGTSIRFGMLLIITMAAILAQVGWAPFESKVLNSIELMSLISFMVLLSVSAPFVVEGSASDLQGYNLGISAVFVALELLVLALFVAAAVSPKRVSSWCSDGLTTSRAALIPASETKSVVSMPRVPGGSRATLGTDSSAQAASERLHRLSVVPGGSRAALIPASETKSVVSMPRVPGGSRATLGTDSSAQAASERLHRLSVVPGQPWQRPHMMVRTNPVWDRRQSSAQRDRVQLVPVQPRGPRDIASS
jgi:hypothetical protein